MKKKLNVQIAWVAALVFWYTPAFAGVDRCASPSAEEFARNPELSSSASAIRDIAARVRQRAEPLIAASVAREREAERERQAEQARLRAERQAERARRQAAREAERARAAREAERARAARQAEIARRQAEWEAGRPAREARKRELARQRELDRQEAEIRRQNWQNAIDAVVQGVQAWGASQGVSTSSGGIEPYENRVEPYAPCTDPPCTGQK